jgi:HD-like signal output (HDOD) protein
LNPDDALLAGLMHNVGFLPLIQLSSDLPAIDDVENPYWLALRELHTEIGAQLLQKWNFPEAIIKSAKEHDDLARNPSPVIELVDVVIVAQLTLAHTPEALAYSKLPQLIPAYTKLGVLSPAMFSENEQLKADFVNAYQFLAA